ncbi:MAG: hypothetical protein HON55_01795 [Legionellales bacterium]|jgi:hypothetical protein|nr:hypothetical protein [Legionellales bacterium]
MNLISIKNYFEQHTVASLAEIAAYFNVSPLDIECYFSYWEHRGNLVICNKSCASGCDLCYRHNHIYYKWQTNHQASST